MPVVKMLAVKMSMAKMLMAKILDTFSSLLFFFPSFFLSMAIVSSSCMLLWLLDQDVSELKRNPWELMQYFSNSKVLGQFTFFFLDARILL